MPLASSHALNSRFGAHLSWARTPDRGARTRPARSKSPASIEYHLNRLDPELFEGATDAQRLAAAESAKRAYFAELAVKSVRARKQAGDAA